MQSAGCILYMRGFFVQRLFFVWFLGLFPLKSFTFREKEVII